MDKYDLNSNPSLVSMTMFIPQKYHASLHTNAYYNYVYMQLLPVAGNRMGVEMALASIKKELLVRSAIGIRWD